MKVKIHFNTHYQPKKQLIKVRIGQYNVKRIKQISKGKIPMDYWNLALEKIFKTNTQFQEELVKLFYLWIAISRVSST